MHTMREHMDSTSDSHGPDGPVVNPGPDSEAIPFVVSNIRIGNLAPAGIAGGIEIYRNRVCENTTIGFNKLVPTSEIVRTLPGQCWMMVNPDQCCLDYVTIQSSAGKLVLCSMQESPWCSVEYKPIRKEDMATVELL